MKRWAVICILLCVVFSGCKSDEPVPPPEETPVPGGAALDAVTYVPEMLLAELEARMQDGKNDRVDYGDLLVGENVTGNHQQMQDFEKRAREMDCYICSFYEVDFDNDGLLDVYGDYTMSPSVMSLNKIEFYRALPEGGYDDTVYFMENYMGYPFFIQWDGSNYCVYMRWDRYLQDDTERPVFLGMQVSCFADGWEQERVYLNLDPDTGEITRDVYTLGVNTEFPLPTH